MSGIVECITNPNCEKVSDCDKKIDCTVAMERTIGLTKYVCGRTPCQYSKKKMAEKCVT